MLSRKHFNLRLSAIKGPIPRLHFISCFCILACASQFVLSRKHFNLQLLSIKRTGIKTQLISQARLLSTFDFICFLGCFLTVQLYKKDNILINTFLKKYF